jgi:D-inositol-3-phosphate glycosyltransferase
LNSGPPVPQTGALTAALRSLAAAIAPQVIFIFNSFLALPRYWELPALLGSSRPLLVAQCPLLGEAVDPRLVARLAFFDCLVVLSQGVKRHFQECLTECRDAGLIARIPRIDVIPHGFDCETFHVLSDGSDVTRQRLKREVFGECIPDDSFIILNANRNEPRKRIDVTLHGFAQFARNKAPGIRLYLHMGDPDGALRSLADTLGIGKRVTIGSPINAHPNLSDCALNRLYNACDVGINTASAEGWGMVSFEHAATGAPQIVPGHGVCGEVWDGFAEILPAEVIPQAHSRYTKESLVSPESVAAALQRLYQDAGYRAQLAGRSRSRALRPEFQWSGIGQAWIELLHDLLGRRCDGGQ